MPRNKRGIGIVERRAGRQNRTSVEAALLKHAVVTIPAKDRKVFKAWIERPAETIPALAELARRRDFCT